MPTPKYDLLLQSEAFHKSIAHLGPNRRAGMIELARGLDMWPHCWVTVVLKLRTASGVKIKMKFEIPPAYENDPLP